MRINITFNRAAADDYDPGVSVFWLMVFAIAILDDSDRRERERRKRDQAHRPPCGPQPGNARAPALASRSVFSQSAGQRRALGPRDQSLTSTGTRDRAAE